MKLLIILALLWVLWLVIPRRWRRFLIIPAVVLAIGSVLISPIGMRIGLWGLTVFVPPDSGESVQTIVVLGRGKSWRELRVSKAQELWQSDRAPHIFVSGMSDADAIIQSLKQQGIPEQSLSGEECSQSTEENGVFTAAILQPQGIQKILLVTDPAHMLRSFLVFRSFRFQVIPHFSPMIASPSLSEQLRMELREYLGLVEYALTGKFFLRNPASLDPPPSEVTHKLQNWNCQRQGISFE